jgi:hypothetical protein
MYLVAHTLQIDQQHKKKKGIVGRKPFCQKDFPPTPSLPKSGRMVYLQAVQKERTTRSVYLGNITFPHHLL